MKTRLLIIIGIISVSVFSLIYADSVFALPFISPEHSYGNAKHVVVGRVLSVEILSEPYVQNSTGIYSQRFGFALYEIQVDEFLKNSINNSTMKVLGKYTNERNTMSYVTYPYEVNQKVLVYIQEINEIPGYDLIITPANSRAISDEFTDEQICGVGNVLVDGICIPSDQLRVNEYNFRESLQTGETISNPEVIVIIESLGAILIVSFIIIYAIKKRSRK